ncbi:MAG: chemotaxis protein CheD [Acidobacteria bacterium]|nr:chemotaxis protein CheD [Acidobacteriota bacterium]
MIEQIAASACRIDGLRRIVIGIGELAVSNDPEALMITHALGSCVAVCLWDPYAAVAGLLHILLPDSRINEARAATQPAAFADTGVPLLFRTAYEYGAEKRRCRVRLVGGADLSRHGSPGDTVGRRNVLATRSLLWKNGVLIDSEEVGGNGPRSVALHVRDGSVRISSHANASQLREVQP